MADRESSVTRIACFCFFVLAVAANLYWLLYPATFPQLKKAAAIIVEQDNRWEALSRLNKQYPQLPLAARDKLLAQALQKRNEDSRQLKAQINRAYEKLKAPYQNDLGLTYLLGVDAYGWMRYTRFILENGYPGNKKINNTAYDTFMLAPYGAVSSEQQFLFYGTAWLYRASQAIASGLSLERFLFYLPLFFAIIFFITLYYFCSYFFSRPAAILAILFVGFSPIFIERASAGRFDSDVLNLFFPLLIFWLLAMSLQPRSYRSKAVLCTAAGFILSVYAATWVGWWLILLVVLAFYLYYALRVWVSDNFQQPLARNKLQTVGISAAAFFLSSEFFCLTLAGIEPFSQAVGEIIANIGIVFGDSVSAWPNLYWLVSELLPLDIHSIITSPARIAVLCFYGFGIIWAVLRHSHSGKHAITTMLLFWLLIMGAVSYRAQRFMFFAIVPAGIFLGGCIAVVVRRITASLRRPGRGVGDWLKGVACLLAVSLLLQFFYRDAGQAAAQLRPMLTDDYYNFLQLLKQKTPPETIVNTWWDYGNWVKEIARRRVLFDPQSQNRPVAYWLAQALCTDSEEVSVRILRMLNNSSDQLFYRIRSELNDDFKSICLLKDILRAEPGQADSILRAYGISGPLRAEIRGAVFEKKPAPAYLVLDGDMLGKISSISYVANWDFAKAYVLAHKYEAKKNLKSSLMELFSLDAAAAEEIVIATLEAKTMRAKKEILSQRWVFNPLLGKSNDRGREVHFSNGIVFKRNRLVSGIFSLQEKKFKTFETTIFFDGERLRLQRHLAGELSGGALIVKAGRQWRSIGFSDQALGLSMLSRLFFMQAEGLKYFELCFANDEAGIYAYEIKW